SSMFGSATSREPAKLRDNHFSSKSRMPTLKTATRSAANFGSRRSRTIFPLCRHPSSLPWAVKCAKNLKIFVQNFVCQQTEPRLVGLKFFTIVLGGTAALHVYRAWGAVVFFGITDAVFFCS